MVRKSRILDSKLKRLRTLDVFSSLPPEELRAIASALREVTIPAGTLIFDRGDLGEEFYVIERGLASVSIGGHAIATLGPGEVFGEMAATAPHLRSASVTAKTALEVFVAPMQLFERVFRDAPPFGLKVLGAIDLSVTRRLPSEEKL